MDQGRRGLARGRSVPVVPRQAQAEVREAAQGALGLAAAARDAGRPRCSDAAWPRDDIDRFILAELEAKGLEPVARRRHG